MPTVAQTPRARVICESCPASAAPERDFGPHGDDAPAWREQRAGAAPAPRRPCLRAMRAARRSCADPACVRCEQRAGAALPPFDPACHGARLPAAIDGATLLHPYHTERALWFYVLAAQPHQP